MKNKLQIQLVILFWIIVALDITGIATDNSILIFIAKPLLVPVLILLLTISKTIIPGKNLMLTGLVFSWLGDMFLLFEDRNPLFFIFGLVCFLTTHICYIIYFLKTPATNTSLLKKQPWLVLLVIGYGVALVWLLFPHLGHLKIPVLIYAAIICTMLLCSLHIFFNISKLSRVLYVSGAALFVVSDSLLALNKFYQPFFFAGVLIMLTYCSAQYLIVTGFIKQLPRD